METLEQPPLPWFRRETEAPPSGNYPGAFGLIGQLLSRLFTFNEVGVSNQDHFAAKLETDSRRRFRHQLGTPLSRELDQYFNPDTLHQEAQARILNDPEEEAGRRAARIRSSPTAAPMSNPEPIEVSQARTHATETRPARLRQCERALVYERLGVLEVLLVNLHLCLTLNRSALNSLLVDLRDIFAEMHIALDVNDDPPRLIPHSGRTPVEQLGTSNVTNSTQVLPMAENQPPPDSSTSADMPVMLRLKQQLEQAHHLLAAAEVPSGVVHLWVRRSYHQLTRIYGDTTAELQLFPRPPIGTIPDPRLELTLRLAVLQQLADDLAAVPARSGAALQRNRVFIGHGRSQLWRHLKDFISERLYLPWDEFNREPTAGYTTTERLDAMLSQASLAFLVLTGEDEHADTKLHARENVVHEVGLFQGRLGRRRAILLVEEGCAEFSNIQGLTQIRFPKDDIAARFEDIRRVLERERLLKSG
jgi:hypothetical protein